VLTPVAGVTLAALLALPASAIASTKSKSATAAGDFAIASATAKCPSGQRATGGGFKAPAQTGPLPHIRVYESRKVGQRSWRASGQVSDLAATGQAFAVTSFVYCRDGAPVTKSKSASVTSGSGFTFLAADAKCKSGQAQAGGFLGPPPSTSGGVASHQVTDSYRIDKRTWRARMRSDDVPGVTFTSFVYCAEEKKPAARLGSMTATTSSVPVTALSAECKRGAKPVAGGFSQPGATTGGSGAFLRFNESFKSGKRWQVSAFHAGTPTTLNSIAYCA
jgi:hypothetical protein